MRWTLQCVELPGAISEVDELDQAADMIREAIAFVGDIPEDSFDIVVRRLPSSLAFLIAHQDEIAERFIPRWYRPPAGHHRRPGHHRQPPAARGRRDGPPVSGEAIGERGSEGGERIPSAPGAVFTRRRQTGWLWRGRCASRATAKDPALHGTPRMRGVPTTPPRERRAPDP
jgi:hypothetical protein